ncbi:uncharacterized protein CCOS01_06322 [Colletotrichum costaricense]|uniref:Uncharacterized protein n=1 Tax=Colletotrichum costaricense TaxID=1209916 RepID=A0AAI9YY92_9PEZI|nr:uncharacterized protein CCOS01_06322 [Colletotrichum costaricense]KAK1528488.1 hypothetical protein CCOS01_06322 [Colletotrichum costaricense]
MKPQALLEFQAATALLTQEMGRMTDEKLVLGAQSLGCFRLEHISRFAEQSERYRNTLFSFILGSKLMLDPPGDLDPSRQKPIEFESAMIDGASSQLWVRETSKSQAGGAARRPLSRFKKSRIQSVGFRPA